MVLQFKFNYESNNNTLINFLIRIADESNVSFEIQRDKNITKLFVEDEEKALLDFSDYLSSHLPMSIYLSNTSVDVVDEIPEYSNIKDTSTDSFVSFCSSCLENVEDEKSKDYYNPFTVCDLCTSAKDINDLNIYSANEKKAFDNYQKLFEYLASNISDNKKIKIKTFSGTFIVQKINELKDNDKLICTNLENISNLLVAKKAEVVALASIEKPSIDLKVNEIYKHKNMSDVNTVNVRCANDLILYLFSKELIKKNIDFLHCSESIDFDISLDFEENNNSRYIDIPKIKILDNNRVLMLESDSYDKSLKNMYDKFDEKNKGQFMTLLYENSILDKSIINFYSSSKDDDNISIYSKEIDGFLNILNFTLPNSIEDIFHEIKKEETGNRLLNNYEKKFPQNYKNAISYDISKLNKNSIISFWKIVEKILGLSSDIMSNASSSLLEKGPRIDYKLKDSDKIYNREFNILTLIKSGISFKLAGLDENTISLGYLESYAHFISNTIDEINAEVVLDGISLCGDLFANTLISNFVHKSITKNYEIYYNKDFVIQV